MEIEKIILTADFLREPQKAIKEGGVRYNVVWLTTLFGDLLKEISNIEVACYFDNLDDFRNKLYNAYNFFPPYKNTDWHKVFYSNEIKTEVKELFLKYFAKSLIVGIELPKIFLNYFNHLNIPYVNLIVHPIRYMDDLAMGINTNNELIYEKLAKYQVSADLFKIQATYIKTALRMRQNLNLIENSCVIFGQTSEDISILKEDSSLDNLLNYKEEITKLSNKYSHIYFKPHPYCQDNEKHINFLQSICKNFSTIENISAYDLYSNENISLCVSLSSGSLYEAKFFGKNIQYLLKPPFLYGENFINKNKNEFNFKEIYITTYKDYLLYDFWIDILSPILQTKEKTSIAKYLNLNNTFRHCLGATWSFNDNKSIFVENTFSQLQNQIANFKQKRKKFRLFKFK